MATENPSVRQVNDQSIVDLFDASLVIQTAVEKEGTDTVLLTSVNHRDKVAYATVHLAKLLQSVDKKVLILNLDYKTSEYVETYFQTHDESKEFIDALEEKGYLSDAIFHSQYPGLDFTVIEEYEDRAFINLMLSSGMKEKLVPLREFYDVILMIGPEHGSFMKYGNIFNMAEAVIPVVDVKKNNLDTLRALVDDYRAFGLKSLGVLRGK